MFPKWRPSCACALVLKPRKHPHIATRSIFMAAMTSQCSNNIRVRLHFDYPPPAVVDCRMCWLLVDLNTCRMVSDLESIVRQKFEFSRRSIISLFIEDCYLPHTENIYVVRDNDSIRVKVDCWSIPNGHPKGPGVNGKKRQRAKETNGEEGNGTCVQWPETKRKETVKGSEDAGAEQTSSVHNKKKPRMKKKKQKAEEIDLTVSCPPRKKCKEHPVLDSDISRHLQDTSHLARHGSTKKDSTKKDSTEDSTMKNSKKKNSKKNSKKKDNTSPKTKVSKVLSSTQPAKNRISLSSSSSSSSSSDTDVPTVNVQPEKNDLGANKCCVADESEGTLSKDTPSPATKQSGDQISQQLTSCDPNHVEKMDPPVGNGAANPPPDYSTMPLLAAPPQAGQKIAFKLLELTENYTPEVSGYKEGRMVSYDPVTRQIQLELLSATQEPSEPGKFDLVYQNPDGSELVEYAVRRESWVKERWESLLEPRLII
ncbi:coilin [Entelurus aequoreus]|uniref:coilin n=1 Tax=Entelurus aequoreus TaxID=161455 RepID=UPI002B1E1897|nr:coilin [Entelurus aequoreus]